MEGGGSGVEWLRALRPGAGPSEMSLRSVCLSSFPPEGSLDPDRGMGRLEEVVEEPDRSTGRLEEGVEEEEPAGAVRLEEDWMLMVPSLVEVLCWTPTPLDAAAGWGKASRGGRC